VEQAYNSSFLITLGLLLVAVRFVVVEETLLSAEAFTPEIQPLPADSPLTKRCDSADNPMTPEKAALGRQLFFDERLSIDGSSRATRVTFVRKGLTDGLPKAIGAANNN
jgi:cytochrome c peroxidase